MNLGTNLYNIFQSIGAGGLANIASGSSALMETATDWEIGSEQSSGTTSHITYSDLVGGFRIIGDIFSNQFDSSKYYSGGYTNGDTSVNVTNISSINSTSTLSQSTVYPVGNRNGYLNGYTPDTGTMHFVDADIRSWTRNNDYVNFNMGNGTSFVAKTSGSTEDIFKYTTDGINTYYAKIGMTSQDNTFQYTDGVLLIGSSDHQDTVNLSTYERNVDLRNGSMYLNIDNIDARNSSSTYYQRQLIGNEGNNHIYASKGDSLWGGAGNDELFGDYGNNTFYYGVGEGNDVIRQSVATDKVDLYNVQLADISGYGYNGSSLVLNMAGGESLTIEGQDGASNFILADRSEYSFNRSNQTWTQTV